LSSSRMVVWRLMTIVIGSMHTEFSPSSRLSYSL
jgi:hypothetical protein